ncbi:MAG: hypothetical protein HQ541_22605, partial [Mariniphaga sp.]|nr:hypothetical protein [Mariniphaga sp.]
IVGFVVFKSQHLHFPYLWDETYSYVPAVLKMVENGSGLLPGAIPESYSKGHPLFFYFLASS